MTTSALTFHFRNAGGSCPQWVRRDHVWDRGFRPHLAALYKRSVIQAVAACANHPEREAIGICVQCRTRVCAECATKIDGINYCVSCLASRAVDKADKPRRPALLTRSPRLSALAHLGVLWLLCFLLLEALLPGGF